MLKSLITGLNIVCLAQVLIGEFIIKYTIVLKVKLNINLARRLDQVITGN